MLSTKATPISYHVPYQRPRQGLNTRELRGPITGSSSQKLTPHCVGIHACLLHFQMSSRRPHLSTVPHAPRELRQVSEILSLSPPQYQIPTYTRGGSHLCVQESRNRRDSKGAGLPFIEAAELEIPYLPAVCVRLSWILCSCKCFHFLYSGFSRNII